MPIYVTKCIRTVNDEDLDEWQLFLIYSKKPLLKNVAKNFVKWVVCKHVNYRGKFNKLFIHSHRDCTSWVPTSHIHFLPR